jgi:hypothetical protein
MHLNTGREYYNWPWADREWTMNGLIVVIGPKVLKQYSADVFSVKPYPVSWSRKTEICSYLKTRKSHHTEQAYSPNSAFLLHIRHIPSSNLDPQTGCPDSIFVSLSSPWQIPIYYLTLPTPDYILSNSLTRLVTSLSPQRSRFDPSSVHVGFMVNTVALEQGFLRVLRFPLSVSLHQYSMPILHLIRTVLSLTHARIKLASYQSTCNRGGQIVECREPHFKSHVIKRTVATVFSA